MPSIEIDASCNHDGDDTATLYYATKNGSSYISYALLDLTGLEDGEYDVNDGTSSNDFMFVLQKVSENNRADGDVYYTYKTLLADGAKAKAACDCNVVTPALENIIETNILLSGLGFESGGLAAAHAVHDGLTVLAGTHHNTHGEKVAFGTLVQLVLENAPMEEINEVLGFCKSVGLPMCLADIGVTEITAEELQAVAEKTCIPEESVHSMPFDVTPDMVVAAIVAADKIGAAFKEA
jgi:glycerol dehydrogenase